MLVVIRPRGFQRQHMLLDETPRAQADVLDLGRKGEVHGRSSVTCTLAPRSYPLSATIWPPSTTMVVPAM